MYPRGVLCPVCNVASAGEDWLKTEEVVYGRFDPDTRECVEGLANWSHCPRCDSLCFYGTNIFDGGLVEYTGQDIM